MATKELKNSEGAAELGGWLILFISGLLCLGALMVFSAGASIDQQIDLKHFWRYSTLRRVAFVPVVWLVLAVVSRCNYRRWLINERQFWLSPVVFLMGLSIALLVLVLIPGIGTEVNYSRRWLVLGAGESGLRFQPSELAKWVTVMFLAVYCTQRGGHIREFRRGFAPACAVLMLVVALIGKEDFGTAVLIGACGVMVMLVGGVRVWYLLVLVPVVAVAFYVLVYSDPTRWNRIIAFLESDSQAQSGAYQARQSIMAIGAGGLWGVGLGQGKIKLGWLPEDTTDFIFAVIGEELGFAGCALVVGLFIGIIVCTMLIIRRTNNPAGKLLGAAIGGTIGAQALMNLLVVTGLAPTKGIALPFVSAGGSGLVMTAMAAGVLVNIARNNIDASVKSSD